MAQVDLKKRYTTIGASVFVGVDQSVVSQYMRAAYDGELPRIGKHSYPGRFVIWMKEYREARHFAGFRGDFGQWLDENNHRRPKIDDIAPPSSAAMQKSTRFNADKPKVDDGILKELRATIFGLKRDIDDLKKQRTGAEFQLTGKVEDTTASDVRTQGKQIRALFAKFDDLQKAVWSAAQSGDRTAENVAREGMHETSRQLYRHIMDRQCGYTDMRLEDIESWLVAEIKKRRDMPEFIRDQTMEAYFVRNHKKYAHDIEWLLDVHRCQVEEAREERDRRN